MPCPHLKTRALRATLCRFTGSLPNGEWGKGNMFTRLRKLQLANNDFSGPLPYWNMRGAWRSLEELDLSSNRFYGGCGIRRRRAAGQQRMWQPASAASEIVQCSHWVSIHLTCANLGGHVPAMGYRLKQAAPALKPCRL